MADEERFITRVEYYKDQKANQERHHEHEKKFTQLMSDNRRMLEDLNGLPKTFDKLSSTLDVIGERLTDVEYRQRNLKSRMETVETSNEQRDKHNTKIWVAVIGASGVIGASALGLAQVFF